MIMIHLCTVIYFVQVKLSALCLSAILACLFGALVMPVFWVWYFARPDEKQWLYYHQLFQLFLIKYWSDALSCCYVILRWWQVAPIFIAVIFCVDGYFKYLLATTSDCCCIFFFHESFLSGTTSLHWIHFSSNDIIIVVRNTIPFGICHHLLNASSWQFMWFTHLIFFYHDHQHFWLQHYKSQV